MPIFVAINIGCLPAICSSTLNGHPSGSALRGVLIKLSVLWIPSLMAPHKFQRSQSAAWIRSFSTPTPIQIQGIKRTAGSRKVNFMPIIKQSCEQQTKLNRFVSGVMSLITLSPTLQSEAVRIGSNRGSSFPYRLPDKCLTQSVGCTRGGCHSTQLQLYLLCVAVSGKQVLWFSKDLLIITGCQYKHGLWAQAMTHRCSKH